MTNLEELARQMDEASGRYFGISVKTECPIVAAALRLAKWDVHVLEHQMSDDNARVPAETIAKRNAALAAFLKAVGRG